MKKTVALFLALALSLLSLSGCGGLFDGLFSTALPTEYPFSENYSSGSEMIEGALDRLHLTWLFGTVHIRSHKEDCIEIREAANLAVKEEYAVHWWYRKDGAEDVLSIEYAASGIKDFGSLEKDLILLVPEGRLSSITVTVDSADVKVDLSEETPVGKFLLTSFTGKVDVSLPYAEEVSLSAHCHAAAPQGKDTVRLQSTGEIGTLSVSSTYSDLDLSLGNAEKVTLAGAEGDIFLRGRGVSATETSTSRGKTQIYLQSYESIDAQSYTGAIDLTLPEALGFSLTVLPNGGARPKNVSVNFEGAVQNGDSFTVKDGGGTITVKTGGNLEVTPF